MESITNEELREWCRQKTLEEESFGIGENLITASTKNKTTHLVLKNTTQVLCTKDRSGAACTLIRYIDFWMDPNACMFCYDELVRTGMYNTAYNSFTDYVEETAQIEKTTLMYLNNPPEKYSAAWFEMLRIYQVCLQAPYIEIEETKNVLEKTTKKIILGLNKLVASYKTSELDPDFKNILITWIISKSSEKNGILFDSIAYKFFNLNLPLNKPISEKDEENLLQTIMRKIPNNTGVLELLPEKPQLELKDYTNFAAWVRAEVIHEELQQIKKEHEQMLEHQNSLREKLTSGEKILLRINIHSYEQMYNGRGVLQLLLALPRVRSNEKEVSILFFEKAMQELQKAGIWPNTIDCLGKVKKTDTAEILETALGLKTADNCLAAARLLHQN